MLANLKARRDREEGFTLIELMVVVLIIAILIAIAIPTFLGARERAQDRAAQSSARNALTAAKTIFTDTESYNPATPAAMDAVEPSLDYLAASTGPNEIAHSVSDVVAGDGAVITLAVQSRSGECFFLHDVTKVGGALTPGTYYDSASGLASCDTASAPGAWTDSW